MELENDVCFMTFYFETVNQESVIYISPSIFIDSSTLKNTNPDHDSGSITESLSCNGTYLRINKYAAKFKLCFRIYFVLKYPCDNLGAYSKCYSAYSFVIIIM